MNDTSQSDQIQALLKRQAALEAAVADMDSLAEQGLDEIRAVARVSLLALQASETHKFPLASFETLAQVLTMIAAKADDYRDLMMFHANGVGIESEQTYRVRARRKASMDALQSCEGVAA